MLKGFRPNRRKGYRFLVTGVTMNLSLLAGLEGILRLGFDYRIAVTVTYVLGMLWGYTQNRLWSWGSDAPVVRSFARYLIVYVLVYLVHLLIVMLLVEGLSVAPLVATIVSVAVLTVPIYVLLDRFVFVKGTK